MVWSKFIFESNKLTMRCDILRFVTRLSCLVFELDPWDKPRNVCCCIKNNTDKAKFRLVCQHFTSGVTVISASEAKSKTAATASNNSVHSSDPGFEPELPDALSHLTLDSKPGFSFESCESKFYQCYFFCRTLCFRAKLLISRSTIFTIKLK